VITLVGEEVEEGLTPDVEESPTPQAESCNNVQTNRKVENFIFLPLWLLNSSTIEIYCYRIITL
jgi:hypothetical protein